jgi:predicted ATP-grasp superfamily ATP-dependent carboligase
MPRSERDWPHVVVLEPHSAGLALARTMVKAGARVTMLAQPGNDWETHSRGVESVVVDFGARGESWLEAIERLASDSDELLVLSASDRGSELLVQARDRLPANVRAFERADNAHLTLMHKESAEGVARRAGVNVPWTMAVRTLDELEAIADEAPWPCVVKPILSHTWKGRYGDAQVFVVHDSEEAAARLRSPLQSGLGMLLSQYVPGGDDHMEEAIVVRLADGSYPVAFGCHKLRQSPLGFGATALGVSDPLPETTALARAVLDEAGFVGVAGVEAKRHAQTGERWFIEVNVRMPAQWGLGDAAGADASRRLVAVLAGRELGPAPVARAGVNLVVPLLDARSTRALLRQAPAWRRPALATRLFLPYLRARELGLLDPRDPGPGLAAVHAVLGRRVKRLARR